MSKDQFKQLQKTLPEINNSTLSGAVFFALNRSSFSGSTLSGGMSPNHPRFNESAIKRLREFEIHNVSVENLSFEDSLKKHNEDFLYLDPPYYIQSKLYGNKGNLHKQFNHEKLAEMLKTRKNWILSYNNCDEIKELYNSYEFVYPDWKYGMGNDKSGNEILIINY
jgi:DNA adenine methylase